MGVTVAICEDYPFIEHVLMSDWEAAAADGLHPDEFNPDDGSVWLTIWGDEGRIGVWNLEAKTNIAAQVHLYIYPQFRRKYWNKLADSLVNFMKSDTCVSLLIAEIPGNRRGTQMCALKTGFKRAAVIPDCIVEEGELTSLHIFTRRICDD